jgi:uncharacterized protein YndB with AHSA1/START domain
MKTIHHVFDIAAPPAEVFGALSTGEGLASWWTSEVQADTTASGSVRFTFSDDFNPQMRIEELSAPGKVRWTCVGGHDPWLDNRFEFELEATEAGTRLRFWQHYARELSDDAYGVYNFNWGYYLESLRLRCETGIGKPYQVAA